MSNHHPTQSSRFDQRPKIEQALIQHDGLDLRQMGTLLGAGGRGPAGWAGVVCGWICVLEKKDNGAILELFTRWQGLGSSPPRLNVKSDRECFALRKSFYGFNFSSFYQKTKLNLSQFSRDAILFLNKDHAS